jgi:hypothetical protein
MALGACCQVRLYGREDGRRCYLGVLMGSLPLALPGIEAVSSLVGVRRGRGAALGPLLQARPGQPYADWSGGRRWRAANQANSSRWIRA